MLANISSKVDFIKIAIITKKELGHYLNNPYGYIVPIIFGMFSCFLFVKGLFLEENGSMRSFFDTLSWLLLLFIPISGMGLIAEEKRTKTLEVLLSLPVKITEVVIGKFLSLLLFCLVAILLTFSIPIALYFISSPHIPTIIVSYLGTFFLIGLVASITLYFSSITSSQIVALLLSLLITFCLFVINSNFFSTLLPRGVNSLLLFISPLHHIDSFYKGIIDAKAVAFFVGLTSLFLSFTYYSIKKYKT